MTSAKNMTLRAKALVIMHGLLGVVEHGGNNHGPMVEKIIHLNGGVAGEPWCGDTLAYAYRLAGSKVVTRSWASVRMLGYLTGMVRLGVRKGKAGDILTYTFDHCGMLVGYYRQLPLSGAYTHCNAKDATHVRAIEGNTGMYGSVSDSSSGDGVHEKYRPIEQVSRVVRVLR